MGTFLQKYFDLTKINTSFSFAPFYQFLQKRIENEDYVKRKMLQYFATRIEEAGVQEKDISADELPQYKELLDILYVGLTNITIDGTKDIWGVTAPFTSTFAYGTPLLYQFFIDQKTGWLKPEFISNFKEIGTIALKSIYKIILHRLYGMAYSPMDEFVYRYLDHSTGLYKFFKINFNHDFIEIMSNAAMPEIDEQIINGTTDDDRFLKYALKTLPLTSFKFRGFVVLTLTDVTQQQSLAYIKERLWKLRADERHDKSLFEDLHIAVKSLLNSNKIEIGAMPFLLLNDKMVRKHDDDHGLLCNSKIDETEICTFFKEIEASGKPVIISDIRKEPDLSLFVSRLLKSTPYLSYAAIPIMYQQEILGILELYASEPDIISAEKIKPLESLYAELAQLMKMGHEIFQHSIREVISNRFTVIQPSVAWKFDEVAFKYFQQQMTHGKVIETVPIVFESVFPLYGAVDIRNSSLIRNNAIRADWQLQLQWLQKMAKELAPFKLLDIQKLIQRQIDFFNKNNIDRPISSETISVWNTLDRKMLKLIKIAKQGQPEIVSICQAYLEAIDINAGSCSINRRNLDVSMQQVISGIDVLLDEMNKKMQQIFPAYYNKFRTDGIEYDLYVGKSINPQMDFNTEQLHMLHALQLEYMRKVALSNAAQQHALLVPLQSTQLIFVNTDVIDITFREDEKRFDVEGAYNIRYQMIKKRIDKIHLLDSSERLTQPGKIAIVYFNESDVADYRTQLHELKEKGMFSNLEYLELEELQGITGLKALRVTVEDI